VELAVAPVLSIVLAMANELKDFFHVDEPASRNKVLAEKPN
jgi:hypothetical protein